MSNIPAQERAVDPFASYNSNVVNQLTRIVTQKGQNVNGLIAIHTDLQVDLTTTIPKYVVKVYPGVAYKDDVFIRLTSPQHGVDFRDSAHYVDFGTGFDETGYYYIVLEYNYMKSRPAPQAELKIIKPSQRVNFDWSLPSSHDFIFLKAIHVINDPDGPAQIIDQDPDTNRFDADPEDPQARRRYVREYAGTEVNLPSFHATQDVSRIVYDLETDKFWFGYSDRWDEVGSGGSVVSMNTSGKTIGDLCYVNASGVATKAISTGLTTGADFVVKEVAVEGKGLTSGIAYDVRVETAIVIAVGDLLYLSSTVAGRVTNVRPDNFFQVVGRALTAGSSFIPIDIIFSPKVVLTLSVSGRITIWSGPTSGLYYKDIDLSSLDTSHGVHATFYDNADVTETTPAEVQIIGGGDTLRVFFPINTLSIDYLISSQESYGVGGGGGGSSLDHSALTNLSYATAGHSGFSPNPHGNSNHSDPASVPSGAILLFESDTAISGYTLLTTQDDDIVYITKGSAAGGESGASAKVGSTWTQPAHVHSGASHAHLTSDHTLTIPEMPAHTHPPQAGVVGFMSSTGNGLGDSGNQYSEYPNTGSTGGDGAHNHGPTLAGGTSDTGSSASVGWRPQGRNFTRQQKI